MRKILLLVLALGAFALSAQASTGDVNSDGEVNISDVNALIDQITFCAPGTVHRSAIVLSLQQEMAGYSSPVSGSDMSRTSASNTPWPGPLASSTR